MKPFFYFVYSLLQSSDSDPTSHLADRRQTASGGAVTLVQCAPLTAPALSSSPPAPLPIPSALPRSSHPAQQRGSPAAPPAPSDPNHREPPASCTSATGTLITPELPVRLRNQNQRTSRPGW